jgi:NADPH-dependent curcumin reductase CurA
MLRHRQWLLKSRPEGALSLGDFEFREQHIPDPELAPGQILVQNLMFSCAATMRNWMNAPGRSHRSIDLGTPMLGPGGSQVVKSNHARFPVGTRVTLLAPWEDYSVLEPDTSPTPITALPSEVKLTEALGIYSLNSCTAYFGLLEVGQPKVGETVVVSAAAGSVGSMVVQIAKIVGCRVIGVAGGRDKCDLVVEHLGADAAIDYKHEDVGARLRELCPKGVDVYFDNVGGDILAAVMDNIAVKGRIAVCGQVASYDSGAPAPGLRDMMRVIYRSVTVRGFVMDEFMQDVDTARADMKRWVAEGRLRHHEDIRTGFENLPHAFMALFNGESRGTVIVESGEPAEG